MSGASMKSNNTTFIAVLVFLAGLLLTLFALLYPNSMNGVASGMMGGSTGTNNYSIANMLLAIVGTFMMAGGVFVAFFKDGYEPLKDAAPLPTPNKQTVAQTDVVSSEERKTEVPQTPNPPIQIGDPVDERLLVLRLLTGDERTVFRAIVDSGGEALQKDLIVKTNMSDAKVSRTLDKLVEKGVVSKTRHGMTNMVRVEIEP
jgi:uncharacterized membrane protein